MTPVALSGIRLLRIGLARTTRQLPSLVPGRVGFGYRLDGILRRMGYDCWQELVQCQEGIILLLETSEVQQQMIFWGGRYEEHVVRALSTHLPDGGVMVDVGANIGSIALTVALECKRFDKSVTVHAVEPLRRNFDRLRYNIKLNNLKNVQCHRTAFGTCSGDMLLVCIGREPGLNGVLMNNDDEPSSTKRDTEYERVPCQSFDGWASRVQIDRLDAIKVDIEGAEPLFFKGGRQTIARFRPLIFGEFNQWWAARHGLSIDVECFHFLRELGYRPYRWLSNEKAWQPARSESASGPEMENTLWQPA